MRLGGSLYDRVWPRLCKNAWIGGDSSMKLCVASSLTGPFSGWVVRLRGCWSFSSYYRRGFAGSFRFWRFWLFWWGSEFAPSRLLSWRRDVRPSAVWSSWRPASAQALPAYHLVRVRASTASAVCIPRACIGIWARNSCRLSDCDNGAFLFPVPGAIAGWIASGADLQDRCNDPVSRHIGNPGS